MIVAAIVGAVIGTWAFWFTLIGGLLLAGFWGGIRLNREHREYREHRQPRENPDHRRRRR